jgi:hypothetical protein
MALEFSICEVRWERYRFVPLSRHKIIFQWRLQTTCILCAIRTGLSCMSSVCRRVRTDDEDLLRLAP